MIRVVIDTNVVVSANLNDEGLPAAILDLAINGHILMCLSEDMFAEYQEVLKRPHLKLNPQSIARSLAIVKKNSIFVKPTRKINVIKRDDSDNRILECAYAAKADYVITGNTKHFPKRFEKISIVNPKEFIDIILPSIVQLPK